MQNQAGTRSVPRPILHGGGRRDRLCDIGRFSELTRG